MSVTEFPRPAACPGCVAAPLAATKPSEGGHKVSLSLPGIHCAGCIATVERGLMAYSDIGAARVNLGQKRVQVNCKKALSPEELIDRLSGLGIAAQYLDSEIIGSDQDRVGRDLLMRMAIAGFAMMNVMLLSVAIWSGASDATRDMFHWISALITLPAVAFSAQPFFRNALAALSAARLNMDVPISLAIILASGMSVFETISGGEHAYFDAAMSLTFFLLIGRYLDHRSRSAARSAAAQLTALEVPRVVRLSENGERETVALAEIAVGDRIAVLPGARVPVDGQILDGRSDIDRSLMTGESLPVTVGPDTMINAGETNLTGLLTVRATAVGDDTVLRRMVTMVDAAESARNRYTALADRAAAIYAPLVHLLAFVAFVGWVVGTGDVRFAMNVAIAVLIITCPCALGLAVPAVSTAAAGRLFRKGMLVKDGTALERLAEIDTIVFDKTGTLTEGLLQLDAVEGFSKDQLGVALALAQASSHPVSRAIASGLSEMDVAPDQVDDITEFPGQGVAGQWRGKSVRLGSADWVGHEQSDAPSGYLKLGDDAPIRLPLESNLRDGAEGAVRALADKGLNLHLISGDTEGATKAVAKQLGFSRYAADVKPEGKVAYVQGLVEDGCKVLMIGDGLNDTAALAAAYASVSPASAADASRAASDVVLLGGSLAELPDLLKTSVSARRRVIENFSIAACYNMIAIPFALAGLATPLAAAIAMSSSSITVLLNALRVRGRV